MNRTVTITIDPSTHKRIREYQMKKMSEVRGAYSFSKCVVDLVNKGCQK